MTQYSSKDKLSKHYQVPVFKFIGKDNRVSRRTSWEPAGVSAWAYDSCYTAHTGSTAFSEGNVTQTNKKSGCVTKTFKPPETGMIEKIHRHIAFSESACCKRGCDNLASFACSKCFSTVKCWSVEQETPAVLSDVEDESAERFGPGNLRSSTC